MNRLPSRRTCTAIAAAVGLLSAAPAALAWGQEGHRVVATIAYARLLPAVRTRVDAILAADTDTLTAPDFASRATWADAWRDSDRSTTKVRYSRTGPWHFVDIELDRDSIAEACFFHPPLPAGVPASLGPAEACVIDKIEQFTAELRDPATTPAERLLALKFVMHFVGDLHQPLHSADRHDQGGNKVPVLHDDLVTATNLHAYWDTWLVQELGRDATPVATTLARAITPQQAAAWATGTASDWADEAFAEARDVTYDFSGQASATDSKGVVAERLDAAYDRRALPVVKRQLSRAGVRLAAILNDALRSAATPDAASRSDALR